MDKVILNLESSHELYNEKILDTFCNFELLIRIIINVYLNLAI